MGILNNSMEKTSRKLGEMLWRKTPVSACSELFRLCVYRLSQFFMGHLTFFPYSPEKDDSIALVKTRGRKAKRSVARVKSPGGVEQSLVGRNFAAKSLEPI